MEFCAGLMAPGGPPHGRKPPKWCRTGPATLTDQGARPDMLLSDGDRICFLGDSITQADPGYTRLLAAMLTAAHPGLALEYVYAGIGGNRVGDLLARLERDALGRQPTWVCVSIGVNDVWHRHSGASGGTSDADFEAGYRELLGRLVAAGVRPIVLTPTVIHEDPDSMENRELQILVGQQRELAAAFNLCLCDLNARFTEAIAARRRVLPESAWPVGTDGRTRFFTTDGVHMNPAGNALMALSLLRMLEGA